MKRYESDSGRSALVYSIWVPRPTSVWLQVDRIRLDRAFAGAFRPCGVGFEHSKRMSLRPPWRILLREPAGDSPNGSHRLQRRVRPERWLATNWSLEAKKEFRKNYQKISSGMRRWDHSRCSRLPWRLPFGPARDRGSIGLSIAMAAKSVARIAPAGPPVRCELPPRLSSLRCRLGR